MAEPTTSRRKLDDHQTESFSNDMGAAVATQALVATAIQFAGTDAYACSLPDVTDLNSNFPLCDTSSS